MRKLLCICTALLMMLPATTAMAADVTGTWTATAQGPTGEFQLTFIFKQDGTTLTGTVQPSQGDPAEIINGKVDGDEFSFDVSINGMTIHHDCTVKGDEIELKATSLSPDFPGLTLTLKRSKTDAVPAPQL